MEDKLKEDLKNLNIPEAKIEEISKKKKFVERLKYVLDQAKVKKGDKELGLLLIQLAEKLNPAYNHRLPLLLKYVIPKDISSAQQLDAAINYLRKKGEEEIDTNEFEKIAGIGVKITPDDIRKEVNNLMNAKLDIIKKQRYNYPSLNILYDLKTKFTFFDSKLAKQIIDEEINKVLGGKNEEELKEEKLRKDLEELKAKQKKEKKNFSEEDKKEEEKKEEETSHTKEEEDIPTKEIESKKKPSEVQKEEELEEPPKEPLETDIDNSLEEENRRIDIRKYDISSLTEEKIIYGILPKKESIVILEDNNIKDKNKVKRVLFRYIFTNTEEEKKDFRATIFSKIPEHSVQKFNSCLMTRFIFDRINGEDMTNFYNLMRIRGELPFIERDNVAISVDLTDEISFYKK